MKKILGLDLGTTSIGWAYVHEAESESETSSISKLGVRVNPLTTDEQSDFEKGRSITVNADRTLKRSARRNLQRYKQRRENLIEVLKENGFISDSTTLAESGKNSTYSILALRAKAATQRIEKEDLARVWLSINKKRGYKSSRKVNNEEEGSLIDGMSVAIKLYEENLTPGEYCYQLLRNDARILPDFYQSDLQAEFDKVWNTQKTFYPEVLTDDFLQIIIGQGLQNTRKRFLAVHQIYTAEIKGSRAEKKLQTYELRSKATHEQLDITEVATILSEINGNLNASSGYLGAISDRSKELYFNKETVGQYQYKQIQESIHNRIKGQTFYRQDYLDEFEQIWNTQKQFHPELTDELKTDIRDIIIFYQRRLKSQKGLISFCEFESTTKEVVVDGKKKTKTIGSRVIPKSSPLFQEFKIWQNLSHVVIKNSKTKEELVLNQETKQLLFDHLNIKGNLKKKDILKLIVDDPKNWDLNFDTLEGNRTNQVLYEAFQKILEMEGHEDIDFKKMDQLEIKEALKAIFSSWGIDDQILEFDGALEAKDLQMQKSYQLWHLLYSYEGDDSSTGNDTLYKLLKQNFGIKKEYATILANVSFQDDYGSLSAKAIRKILPFIKENKYSDACSLAGYNHSNFRTKEENDSRELKDKLDLLPKNSLRNPVVEKILNQVINVVNAIIEDPDLGKPDEVRIELARELKKNAKERAEMTTNINRSKDLHDQYRETLKSDFDIKNPTRNDIIRYKLYLELAPNGHKTLYSNTYIPKEKLFSKEFDIEHIIPKARLFDDSYSNKTLEVRSVNEKKGKETAMDFVASEYSQDHLGQYTQRIDALYKEGKLSKAKHRKLLMKSSDIGEGFIERDLRESQYIAKKAKDLLLEVCRTVVPTTGSITDQLREDWGLINIMQELNLPKYQALGLTEKVEKKNGTFKERIIDWTKRNDHRHHAMDALTVAFTKHSHIQYLNNLNARHNENHKKHTHIYAIEQKETTRDENGKRKFNLPMPRFRHEAKKHLEQVLISHKAKNKVVTRNNNKIAGKNSAQVALTPRGQMHKETVYGSIKQPVIKWMKIGTKFDEGVIETVTKLDYKAALLQRLKLNGGNPKQAFGGKNSPAKSPIKTNSGQAIPEQIKTLSWETVYTIRKDVTPETFKDKKSIQKVVDLKVRELLENRLEEYGNAKEAFSDLDKNPIWMDEKNGISIKSAIITGVSEVESLHNKKDQHGKEILDENGNTIPIDFVSTGNNHHVAIYRDENGKLQEEVVSFFEAVARVNAGVPIVDKSKSGWEFLFTMKQNEMFVFPSGEFNPEEIDLTDPNNYSLISPHLFRVQKFTIKDYFFRHHLETNVENNKVLYDTAWKRCGLSGLEGIIKVRISHLGQIVKIGE